MKIFWMINKRTIIAKKRDNIPLLKLIRIWLLRQLEIIIQLYFQKCEKNDHLWDFSLHCLRCKKSRRQIDIERRLKKIKEDILNKRKLNKIKGLKIKEVKKMDDGSIAYNGFINPSKFLSENDKEDYLNTVKKAVEQFRKEYREPSHYFILTDSCLLDTKFKRFKYKFKLWRYKHFIKKDIKKGLENDRFR